MTRDDLRHHQARSHSRVRSHRPGPVAGVVALAMTMVALGATAAPMGVAAEATSAQATPSTGLLTAVGVFAQVGQDQVVFQFDGSDLPTANVRVVPKPVHADPSDAVVPVAGTVVVQVTMTPASAVDASKPGAPATYTGPTRITLNGASVTEVVESGDFEGVLNWSIGLTELVPFVTTTATSPNRIVINFDHPGVGANPNFTG